MPYKTIGELPDNIKSLPKHAQEIYQKTFNSAWEQHKGEDGAEARCHAIAWSGIKRLYRKNEKGVWVAKEAIHPHGEHACICPKCGETVTVAENVKCNTQECPKCDTIMRAKDIGEQRESMIDNLRAKYADIIQEVSKRDTSSDEAQINNMITLCNGVFNSENVDEAHLGEIASQADSVLMWIKEQKAMKTEDGIKYPAEAFAYVPDADKPSTWKLRLWEDPEKKVTRVQLGRAAAALSPGGFRGNRVQIPSADLAAVKRKIRAGYSKLGVDPDEMPKWVKETETRELLFSYVPLTEAKFDKGRATIIVIKPGFNVNEDRYYPADVLKRDYGIFEGQKMYADHPTDEEDKARPERSIKDWVATLTGVTCDESGTITGVAEIVEPWLMQKLASLRDKGMLSEMGISINAVGSASKATVDGKETLLIEKLVAARSVDFVTEPGAGGVVTFYEADRHRDVDLIELSALKERRPDLIKALEAEVRTEIHKEVKKAMENEEKIKELEGQIETLTTECDGLKEAAEKAERDKAKAEAQAAIKEAVDKAELPDIAKARLIERFKDAETAEDIEEAIKAEVDYLAKLSEAGKVKGLGSSKPSSTEDKKALRESFKKMHPEYTDVQLDIAVEGK